ncbi:hypothetical protein CBR_g23487 [Chara braunii]|uniref:Uncharacterized protein n=1 Tax=Chara braunii TaxID=69332 RepID=A0A388L4C4_CHABU|nr:hypothetical protein CBR_g23487 [Chara braunii]|eukprot:GBG77160.1 hypothetical protein CBR_g23487 [Chara braunii]
MSRGNKTIYPDNLADTSARGEAQMSGDMQRPPSVPREGDAGDGNDEDGGSARESGFSAGSTGGAGKRKKMRQQTFDAIAKVMEKHGTLMADTVKGASKRQCSILEWQCDILEREVDTQKPHYEASDEANRMMCTALMEIVKAIRDSGSDRSERIVISASAPQTPVTSTATIVSAVAKDPFMCHRRATWSRQARTRSAGHRGMSSRCRMQEAVVSMARASWRGKGEKNGGPVRRGGKTRGQMTLRDEDDDSLRTKKKTTRQEELEAKSKLWTDGKTFWGSGSGRLIADAVLDCADYYCAIVNGDEGATASRGLIMPPPDVPCLRIQDLVQRDAAHARSKDGHSIVVRGGLHRGQA